MTKDIFNYLRKYSADTKAINRLIISSYLSVNELTVNNNKELKKYTISKSNKVEFASLLEFNKLLLKFEKGFVLENLIELFEFVVSPADKVINGAIYTPQFIRSHVVGKTLGKYSDFQLLTCADLSCGCGGFLLTMSQYLRRITKKSYFDIYKTNIFGLDITSYSIERAKLLLILNAIEHGEDVHEFHFNLSVGNALSFNRKKLFEGVEKGFNIIVGNPPYVCSRNMEVESKILLEKWSVTSTGHPDLYIPFFQIGIENLEANGILGYITVNTFTKSINGRALRNYFSNKKSKLQIVNFGGEQIFKDRNTYTCLCFIENTEGGIEYLLTSSKLIDTISQNDFIRYSYSELNHNDGWNLTNSKSTSDFIKKIETTGIQFKDKYTTRNGIATLKNDVYKFTPQSEDSKFYYFNKNDKDYKVEKGICRDIINSNKIKNTNDLRKKREKVIFPYTQKEGEVTILSESFLKRTYPNAFKYLDANRKLLSKRDKGDREYETWFAYGRRQSMDIDAYKLFFPHICEKPTFTLCRDRNLLFYNGLAVISDSYTDLQLLKKILESSLFLKYIISTTKNYASGYFSLSKNYLKNFGIYEFTDEQKRQLLAMTSPDEIDSFLIRLYDIENTEKLVLY